VGWGRSDTDEMPHFAEFAVFFARARRSAVSERVLPFGGRVCDSETFDLAMRGYRGGRGRGHP
jgi:hypothetical protein